MYLINRINQLGYLSPRDFQPGSLTPRSSSTRGPPPRDPHERGHSTQVNPPKSRAARHRSPQTTSPVSARKCSLLTMPVSRKSSIMVGSKLFMCDSMSADFTLAALQTRKQQSNRTKCHTVPESPRLGNSIPGVQKERLKSSLALFDEKYVKLPGSSHSGRCPRLSAYKQDPWNQQSGYGQGDLIMGRQIKTPHTLSSFSIRSTSNEDRTQTWASLYASQASSKHGSPRKEGSPPRESLLKQSSPLSSKDWSKPRIPRTGISDAQLASPACSFEKWLSKKTFQRKVHQVKKTNRVLRKLLVEDEPEPSWFGTKIALQQIAEGTSEFWESPQSQAVHDFVFES